MPFVQNVDNHDIVDVNRIHANHVTQNCSVNENSCSTSTSQSNVHASLPACLLTRSHMIEITSNLPFAISLVV